MIRKIIKWLWEPNFAFGEFVGVLAIIYTAAAGIASLADPRNSGIPILCFIALNMMGLAIHHMELFKEKVKK